jgi:nicotinamidase-related amidase
VVATESDRTALLVMDVQRWVVDRFGDDAGWLDTLAATADAARAAGVVVIFVTVAFRRDYPEVSDRSPGFAALRSTGALVEGDPGTAIHPAVTPKPQDLVVTKRRVGAFSGSDLDLVLRARAVDTLVLTGVSTSGVVLSTVRAAADMDYQLVVLRDLCIDGDPDVQRVLLDKLFPNQAQVITAKEWAAGLPTAEARER